MEFFRHCPECGRRFHIKLESKKLVDARRTSRPQREGQLLPGGGGGYGGARMGVTVHEGKPIVVDVEEFDFAYKCGHCGHEWTEKRVERHQEH